MKNVLKCIFLLLVCFLFIGSECENEKQYPYVSTPAADKFINAGFLAYPLDYDSTWSIMYLDSSCLVQLHYITQEGEEKLAVYNPGITITTF